MNIDGYFSTRQLCERYDWSKRTLYRRMQRKDNPMPKPVIYHHGSQNLWERSSILGWEEREKARSAAIT